MCVIIQAKTVKPCALADLLKELHPKSGLDYLIVSNWREIHFVPFDGDHSVISDSDRGRAFGQKSELRWRRSEDNAHFVCRWISDDGTSLEAGDGWSSIDQPDPKDLDPCDTGYLLWGEPLFDESKWMDEENGDLIWYQARIPRKLIYPAEGLAPEKKWVKSTDNTPLVLRVREYQQNGQTMFERFIDLGRYGETPSQSENDKEDRS